MQNTKLKIVAVIQARMESTRLPRKALKKILGKTLIEWIYYRLSFCNKIDEIVLSTSINKENDELVDLAEEIGLEYYRGSEMNLVSRLYETAKKFSADAIVRITGDCPLVDPRIVDNLVEKYLKDSKNIDYVCNVLPPTYPDGMDVEIISSEILEKLDKEVKDQLYREWITTTIMENPDKYRILNVPYEKNISDLRLTVDYPEDFELAEKIFRSLHWEGKIFFLEDILRLFKKDPSLIEINKNRVDLGIINNVRSAEFHNLKKNNNLT